MNLLKKTARVAGLLYLGHFVAFFLADNGVHYTAVEPIDAAATAHNMMASEQLFRIGFVSFLFAAIFFLLSAWALYVLLKPVDKNLALLFVLLNLSGVAIHCVSQLNQLQALAMVFLNVYKTGFMIANIFLAL